MSRSEFERIARLAACFGEPAPPDVGIGDDAAVLHPAGPVLATVDAAVEGRHFRRDLCDLEGVSERAIEAAMSDIAAMGGSVRGRGCGLLLAWALPGSLGDDDLDALARGAQRAASRAGAVIVGGNLTAGLELSLTTTVLGASRGRVVGRSGARVGDVVVVSGPMGAAALGLRALLAGRGGEAEFASFVARWRHPRARLDLADEVARVASAAIDVSDGLAQDAGHVAKASGVGIALRATAIPTLPGAAEAAARLGADAAHLGLTGGEDYELLATGARGSFGAAWVEVGEVVAGEGVRVITADGDEEAVPAGSWDHFIGR